MSAAVDTGHLRQVALSLPEIKTLALVASQGGEVEWHGENASPPARAVVAALVGKKLIEHKDRITHGTIRLTDQGRAVQAQLDAMAVKPRIEIDHT